jgi:hypothetical protein
MRGRLRFRTQTYRNMPISSSLNIEIVMYSDDHLSPEVTVSLSMKQETVLFVSNKKYIYIKWSRS